MMHVTEVCHTCVITLVLSLELTLEKMQETRMVQSNIICIGRFFTSLVFLQWKYTLPSGELICGTISVMLVFTSYTLCFQTNMDFLFKAVTTEPVFLNHVLYNP